MNKKREKTYFNIVFSAVMALCIAVIIIVTYQGISNIATKDCFKKLWDQTTQLRDELKAHADGDIKLLETMSNIIAELPDRKGIEVQALLELGKTGSLVNEVEILFSDGSVLKSDGSVSRKHALLDYEAEAACGAHLTSRMQDTEQAGEWVVYNIVPINYAGKTEALLCGKIYLQKLREVCSSKMQGSESRYHLFEAYSSEFLVDTMHDTLGNTHLEEKVMKNGDSMEPALKNMREGIAGELTFFSNTVSEYLYGVYEPVGIKDWTVMLAIPESVAFENVQMVKRFFVICAVLEAVVLFIYFMVLLIKTRKMTEELEEQYRISNRLREIQELLFRSVLRPEQFANALKKLAEMLTAQTVYLATDLYKNGRKMFSSSMQEGNHQLSEKEFPTLMQLLEIEERVSFSDIETLPIAEEEKDKLRKAKIVNGMGILLKDSDNRNQGILFAVNITKEWKETEPLEWLRFDFSMAIDNIDAFKRIRELGSKDQLTGLLNRHSYQSAMEFYERMGEETLRCVYIDVDGLHELNNQLGHTEGDRMLTTIAGFLQEIFGEETTYRIGGDEFLIFCSGIAQEELEIKLKTLQNSITDAGYHVSLGTSARSEAPLVHEMVRRAEERMYEAKRQYYRERKNGEKVREMNKRLEATLLEKRDLDVFCSVLAYKYVGVYIVNLSHDTTRAINIPDYFEIMLQKVSGKFSEAIKLYTKDLIRQEDQSELLKLFDYDKLYQKLLAGENPEYVYCKKDGMRILIKIYPTPDFDEYQKECICTFELLEEGKQGNGTT